MNKLLIGLLVLTSFSALSSTISCYDSQNINYYFTESSSRNTVTLTTDYSLSNVNQVGESRTYRNADIEIEKHNYLSITDEDDFITLWAVYRDGAYKGKLITGFSGYVGSVDCNQVN